jgi:uncharacterized protein YkwD
MLKMKRTLILLLATAMLSILCCGTVFAAEDTTYTVNVDVTYGQTEARQMLDLINDFRTGSDAWCWDSDDTEKITYTDLNELEYDYELEKAAMQRAAELAVVFDHTRPDGTLCFTAFQGNARGENIAIGYSTAEKAFKGWQETDENYSGQGHRRNMLSSNFTAIAGLAGD